MIVPAFVAGCDSSDDAWPAANGITLNWTAPTEYHDGSFLPWSELDEFRIYVDQKLTGTAEPHVTSYRLELPTGEWEVSMSSVARGIEGLPSDPVLIEVPES